MNLNNQQFEYFKTAMFMVSASAFDEIRILRFTICHMMYICAANEHIQTNKLASECGKNLPASIVTLNKERGN